VKRGNGLTERVLAGFALKANMPTIMLVALKLATLK
jgi:hypothetical protein